MKNSIFSLFKWNSPTTQINKTENIYLSKVQTLTDEIRQTFFDGNIARAIKALDKAKQEYQQNGEAKYYLWILEIEFLFQFKHFDKVRQKLSYVETNYLDFLGGKFYEMKASVLALDNDYSSYKICVEKIRNEFSASSIDDEYFEILFLLNSSQIERAEEVFVAHYASECLGRKLENKINFLGGLIYYSLFNNKGSDEYFNKAKEYFDLYGKQESIGYFDELEISCFFSTKAFNKLIQQSSSDLSSLQATAILLGKAKEEFYLFEDIYSKVLRNHYLHCKQFSNKEQFTELYLKFNDLEKDQINFIYYHFFAVEGLLGLEEIEQRILDKNEPELLIHYLDRLSAKDPLKLKIFLDRNPICLEDSRAFNIYVTTASKHNLVSIKELISKSTERKKKTEIDSLTFLELQQSINGKLTDKQIERVVKLQEEASEKALVSQIALKLLGQNNQGKAYLKIGKELQKSPVFLESVLKICQDDKTLSIQAFESFILEVTEPLSPSLVGNIFLKFTKLRSAYKYYTLAWKTKEWTEATLIDIACTALGRCSCRYYFINNQREDCRIDAVQDSVYRGFLEEKYSKLSLEQVYILVYFMIVIEKSYREGFKYINQKLLLTSLDEISIETKNMLSSLFFYRIHYQKIFKVEVDTDLVLNNNNDLFINKSQYKDISDSYQFQQLTADEFEFCSLKDDYVKKSLFHHICSQFVHSLESELFKSILVSKDDPFSDLKPILISSAENKEHGFKLYADGEIISFHQLVGEYKKYFGLIPYLLESEKMILDSGFCLHQDAKKILTLSSIIFLHHLNELDEVLKRDDVYIQQTTIDWLRSFISELDNADEIMNIICDGESIYRDVHSKKEINKTVKELLELATRLVSLSSKKVVQDRDEVFGFGESFDMLVPVLGIQEYRALAFSYNHGYQIITEDRIFGHIVSLLRKKPEMVSNAIGLVDIQKHVKNDNLKFYLDLHEKGYQQLFNEQSIIDFITYNVETNERLIEAIQNSRLLQFILLVARKYGWLDCLNNYYKRHYKFYFPMLSDPPKDLIALNIEVILDFTEINNES